MDNAPCPHCNGVGRVTSFWLWTYRLIWWSAVVTGVLWMIRMLLWLLERIANG